MKNGPPLPEMMSLMGLARDKTLKAMVGARTPETDRADSPGVRLKWYGFPTVHLPRRTSFAILKKKKSGKTLVLTRQNWRFCRGLLALPLWHTTTEDIWKRHGEGINRNLVPTVVNGPVVTLDVGHKKFPLQNLSFGFRYVIDPTCKDQFQPPLHRLLWRKSRGSLKLPNSARG